MGTAIGIGVSPSLTPMLGAGSDPILPSGLWLDPDTWTRTGGRFSIGPDLELDANEGDVFCMDGRDVNGIMKAATNLSPALLTAWSYTPGGGQVVVNGEEVTFTSMPQFEAFRDAVSASPGDERSMNIKLTLISGSLANAKSGLYSSGGTEVSVTDISDMTVGESRIIRHSGTMPGGSTQSRMTAVRNNAVAGLTAVVRIENISHVVGLDPAAGFPVGSAASTSYGADLATVTAPAWPATGRTLTVSRRNYTTGVISSVSTTPAPTAGNYVLDGSTDGNYTYLSRVSNNILTAGQIADQEAVMETILAATPEFCPNWDLVGGEPTYVNGIPTEVP